MKKIILALAAVAAMAAGNASAQGYVGGAIGQSRIDTDCEGLSCDKTDTGWKVFGGFKFMPNVAGEVTYWDYGKFTATDGIDTVEGEATAIGVGVALMGDFAPQWSGVARLGVSSNRGKARLVGVGSDTDRKAKPYLGLGVSYAITPQMKIDASADFTKFEFAGESDNVRMLSIGVTYGF